jgi:hypothetical protein
VRAAGVTAAFSIGLASGEFPQTLVVKSQDTKHLSDYSCVDDCPRWSWQKPAGNEGRAKAINPTEARPFAFQKFKTEIRGAALAIYILVCGFDVCFRRQIPGGNQNIFVDKTIFRPSIPKPSVSIHFSTAARDKFANPKSKGNAN